MSLGISDPGIEQKHCETSVVVCDNVRIAVGIDRRSID